MELLGNVLYKPTTVDKLRREFASKIPDGLHRAAMLNEMYELGAKRLSAGTSPVFGEGNATDVNKRAVVIAEDDTRTVAKPIV